MTLNGASTPYRRKDFTAAIHAARRSLRLQAMRAVYATAAFLLSCTFVALFLEGFPLHAYWESFGKYLLLLSMVLLIPFVVLTGLAINAWFFVRNMEKMEA